ncbi:hypothetical protein CRYUN_Cryun06bG0099500 [Craigia yunnanensis]
MEPNVGLEEGWNILEDLTTNADQFQQKLLEEILIKNAERIVVNGEPSDILLAEPINGITLSSGTSRGQAKMMPLTNKQLDLLTYCRSLERFPDGLEQGKQMQLLFV